MHKNKILIWGPQGDSDSQRWVHKSIINLEEHKAIIDAHEVILHFR